MPGGLSKTSAPSSPQDPEAAGLLLEEVSEPTVFPSLSSHLLRPPSYLFSTPSLFLRLFFSLSISFSRSYSLSLSIGLPAPPQPLTVFALCASLSITRGLPH